MSLINIIKRIVFGYKATSDSYIKHLKRIGVRIGENTVFWGSRKIVIDEGHPHMISIGDNVNITGNCIILAHDYSSQVGAVLRDGVEIYGNVRPVKISNNVFLGFGSTILAGTTIEENVIIGAGSIVSGLIEKNSVYAGNPAKKIMSLDDYLQKLSNRQLQDAINIYKNYKEAFNVVPSEKIFGHYANVFKANSQPNKEIEINGKKVSIPFLSYHEFISFVESEMQGDPN